MEGNIGVAVVGFLLGILYTTGGGLYWLDLVDHFMNNYGLFLVGLLESVVIAYFYRAENMRSFANTISERKIGPWWNFSIKWIAPLSALVLLVFSFTGTIISPYGGYPRRAEFLGGWLVLGIFIIISFILSKYKKGGEA